MVYLWGATPHPPLSVHVTVLFFPFSLSFLLWRSPVCVFIYLLFYSAHCLSFCRLLPSSFLPSSSSIPTSVSSSHVLLTHRCLPSSSVFHLFPYFQSPFPSNLHPLSPSPFQPRFIFFFLSFSLSPLFNTYLNFIFLSSSFSFRSLCSLFCSWSLFLPPHISLSVGYISDFYCKFACVTFLMDLAETLANKVPYTVSVIGQWGSHCISMFKQIDILTPSSSGWCSLLSTLAFQVHHIICEWLRDVQWLFTPSTLLEDTTFLFKALR